MALIRDLVRSVLSTVPAVHRMVTRMRFACLRLRYQHHVSSQQLDWQWEKTPYNRMALVNLLTAKFHPCDYLEIGCLSNRLFHAVAAENKVGVDPVSGGTVRLPSDEFFAQNTKKFDVVFIDGLHHYDQVRRDVVNAIACLKPGGWVALHDMLPRNWLEEHVPILHFGNWTGDVWKVAFELTNTPGIDFKILKIDCGVGVFRLTQENPALVDLQAQLKDQPFSYYYEHIHELPIVEWSAAEDWLRRR